MSKPVPASAIFDRSAIRSLTARTEYESWLLEAAYRIVADELFMEFPDSVIYPANGSPPQFFGFMQGKIVIGDWRPGFLNAGAPLIFISTFKLLDMLVESILEQNGIHSTFRFEQKIKALRRALTLPPFLQTRSWLFDRLTGLYTTLEPLRGTIVHDKQFKAEDGAVRVTSRKGKNAGVEVKIEAEELRTFAVTVMSVLRYLTDSWRCDEYREKMLRHDLDRLAKLHDLPALGQRKPFYPTVRVYLIKQSPISIDVKAVAAHLAKQYRDNDCMFDLRCLLVNGEKVTEAFLFPWDVVKSGPKDWGTSLALEKYRASVPVDINAAHLSNAG